MSTHGFSGGILHTCWMGSREWMYIPDQNNPLRYTSKNGMVITLNRPFITDGASIPKLLWSIPWLDPYVWFPAALLHDYLWELRYSGEALTDFKTSNILLKEACGTLNVPPFFQFLIYWSVTLFGRKLWRRGISSRNPTDAFQYKEDVLHKWKAQ